MAEPSAEQVAEAVSVMRSPDAQLLLETMANVPTESEFPFIATIVRAALAVCPPTGLPAVLSSVDDVARVCEAAGFVPAVEDPTFWKDEHDVLVDVVGEYGEDDGLDEVGVQRADDSDVATIHAGAPGWLLWSAIQAARCGEPG